MANINLLPWREELREKKKREFILTSALVAALGMCLVLCVYMFFSYQLESQRTANQKIADANTELNKQLKTLDGLQGRSEEILQRMKLIQDLQSIRPVVVHIFDELAKFSPEQLYLTQLSRTGDQFIIEGRAQDLNVVSDYLRKLDQSVWFRNAFMKSFVMTEAKEQKQGSVAPQLEDNYGHFVVTVDLADMAQIQKQSQAQIDGGAL